MRVVIVNTYARVTGGADRHCLALATHLRGRGHQVSFLSTASPENLEHEGEFIDLTVSHSSRDALPPSARAGAAAKALWNPQAARAMRSMIRARRPDVVHAHKLYPQLSVAPLVISARLQLPIVQTVHDYELISASPIDHRGSWLDRHESRLQYRLLNDFTQVPRRAIHRRLVARWVAISRYQAGLYARRGIRATVLPNFTEPPLGAPLDFAARRGVLFASRLTEEKGTLDVISLARAAPELEVTVAGEGRIEGAVRAAADELANLEFLGRLEPDEVRGRLRMTRLLLMPSRWQEPGGLSALEAMAVGTPVLAYESGGLAEYLRDAGAGLVVEADRRALIEGSRRLATDEGEWRRCSERGIAAAESTHSPERYLDGIESVYREASGGGAAGR